MDLQGPVDVLQHDAMTAGVVDHVVARRGNAQVLLHRGADADAAGGLQGLRHRGASAQQVDGKLPGGDGPREVCGANVLVLAVAGEIEDADGQALFVEPLDDGRGVEAVGPDRGVAGLPAEAGLLARRRAHVVLCPGHHDDVGTEVGGELQRAGGDHRAVLGQDANAGTRGSRSLAQGTQSYNGGRKQQEAGFHVRTPV